MTIVDSSTADTANSIGDTLTSGGGTHTKGAWNEGAAASEVVKIADIPAYLNVDGVVLLPPMPLTIASGARVAARIQATSGNETIEMMIFLSNNSEFGTSTQNETLGADTATSKGTDVDTGASNNTKGAYVELASSLTVDANYVVTMMGNSDNSGNTPNSFLVDIAEGAASSEVDNIANTLYSASANELPSAAQGFFQDFSSGSRMSCRGQGSNNVAAGANDRIIDVAVIVFNLVPPTGGGGGIAQIVGIGGIVG